MTICNPEQHGSSLPAIGDPCVSIHAIGTDDPFRGTQDCFVDGGMKDPLGDRGTEDPFVGGTEDPFADGETQDAFGDGGTGTEGSCGGPSGM